MIQSKHTLLKKLQLIHNKDYGAYQSLKGEYNFSDQFRLIVQQVPKDPYAPPHTGVYRVQVNRADTRIISYSLKSKINEIAFRDFLSRKFYHASKQISAGRRGTGNSGIITINQPGQAILDRNCVVVDDETIEIRFFIGLPATGRRIDGQIAHSMLFEELPCIVEQALYKKHLEYQELDHHIKTAEDAHFLRNQLDSLGMVAFIADNAILPRKSGISNKPMAPEAAVGFLSPESLQLKIELPYSGIISGMGIPKGITLIVGGGYHGKSTLLHALELGCYNHIPGDGRQQCVSMPTTVKIRAYSSRNITRTDISPFIRNLPFNKETIEFTTQNASGSTSQAASIVEAIEVGATVLLMDEDTCAANFMIRDFHMQQLVHKQDEPITPFIDRVKRLYTEKNISTVLVLGGVGDYFEVADHVIQMRNYQPVDVTRKAKEIVRTTKVRRENEQDNYPFRSQPRIPIAKSINPLNQYGKKRIFAKEVHRLNFGEQEIDLTDVAQLIELSQTKAIGYALEKIRQKIDHKKTVKQLVQAVIREIEAQGLDILSEHISGNFAEFRLFELAFAINRLPGLAAIQLKSGHPT